MKKFITILLSLLLVISLCACSKQADEPTDVYTQTNVVSEETDTVDTDNQVSTEPEENSDMDENPLIDKDYDYNNSPYKDAPVNEDSEWYNPDYDEYLHGIVEPLFDYEIYHESPLYGFILDVSNTDPDEIIEWIYALTESGFSISILNEDGTWEIVDGERDIYRDSSYIYVELF